jgi:hypothetical protein
MSALLELLGALQPDGPVSHCWKMPDEQFTSALIAAPDLPARLGPRMLGCQWMSIATIDPAVTSGRGLKVDIRRLMALPLDFDVKDAAEGKGMPTFKDIDAAIGVIMSDLGAQPFMAVNTGHGVQPWWILDPTDPAWRCDSPTDPRWHAINRILKRWSRYVRWVCEQYDGAMDGVFDASRVLRIVGTLNMKDPAAPEAVTVRHQYPNWSVITFKQLDEALAAIGFTEQPEDREEYSDTVTDMDGVTAPASTCPYVKTILDGLATDEPGTSGRHPWLTGKATRIWAAYRYGCLTVTAREAAFAELGKRFRVIIADPKHGKPRKEGPNEVKDAIRDMRRKVETWSDEQVVNEFTPKKPDILGQPQQAHTHDRNKPVNVRPELDVTNSSDALNHLIHETGQGPMSGLYNRGGQLVFTPRIGEEGYRELSEVTAGDEDGPAQVRPVDTTRLQAVLHQRYHLTRTKVDKKTGEVTVTDVLFPREPAAQALASIDVMPNLPRLTGVVHMPVVRADGSLLDQPGYDTGTGLLHLPLPSVTIPAIPEQPTRADIAAARATLLDLLEGFPFESDHHRANYLCALLTPAIKAIVPPPYPLLLIDAPQRGSGKTLLGKTLILIHGGVLRSAFPEGEAEVRKSLTSILSTTTGTIVLFDNVTGVINSATLDGLLTSSHDTDRELGRTQMVNLVNDRVWLISGNNIQIGGDLDRRSLTCRIDAGMEHPERRTEFTIPNLGAHVRDHHGEIIAAILTLVRAWIVAGKPTNPLDRTDDYGPLIATVNGILDHVGIDGVVGHPDTKRDGADPEQDEWGGFLHALRDRFGTSPFTVSDIVNAASELAGITYDSLPGDIGERLERGNRSSAGKSLSLWMKNRAHRFCDGLAVTPATGGRAKTTRWKVETPEERGRSGRAGRSNTHNAGEESSFDSANPHGSDQTTSRTSRTSPDEAVDPYAGTLGPTGGHAPGTNVWDQP